MKKKTTFKLPAEAMEGTTGAVLLGDFNNWEPTQKFELEKQKDGSYKIPVELEAGKTYQYRFLRNDGMWVNDYNAQEYVPSEHDGIDNCLISVSKAEASEKKVSRKATSTKKAAAKKTPVGSKKAEGKKTKKVTTAKTKTAKPASAKVAKKGGPKVGK